jgi:hypothetical protein
MLKKKRLGDRLVEAGVIDKLQLRAALGQQHKWGKTLGRTLLEMRVIEEEELVPILSQHLNMPAVNLAGRQLNPEAVAMLDEPFCRENECLPFAFDEKNRFLDVAMTDAQNEALYDRIRVRTRCNVRPFLAGPDAIRNGIDRAFGEDLQAMKLQFMLTDNVIDFGDDESEEQLDTALETPSGRGQIDPSVVARPMQNAITPDKNVRVTPPRLPSGEYEPYHAAEGEEAPAPRRGSGGYAAGHNHPSGEFDAAGAYATPQSSALPLPSATAVSADEGYDDNPYEEGGYDEDNYEKDNYGDGQYESAAAAQANEVQAWMTNVEDRLAQMSEHLQRQDRFIHGLVRQMRQLFGQLAAQNLLQVAEDHPLIQPVKIRRPSQTGNRQPRQRRMSHPFVQVASRQRPRPPSQNNAPMVQEEEGDIPISVEEEPAPRVRRPSHPMGVPVTPRQPTPDRPQRRVATPTPQQQAPAPQRQAPAPQRQAPAPQRQAPAPQRQAPAPQRQTPAPQRQTAPQQAKAPAPAPMQQAQMQPDEDDGCDFLPGTGQLVESPRPAPEAVRPSPPKATSGAETRMPVVDVPPEAESVVAIDLGTTRSSVATVVDGQVSVLKLPGGDWDIPSVVGFRKDGSVMIGKSARMMLANDPTNAISSPKRLLGHRYDDRALQPYIAQLGMKSFEGKRGDVMLESRNRVFSIIEVCAHIFNLLRLVAERTLDREVRGVVLTTPVSFNDRQYAALAAAAQMAKLKVLEFVPEPVAAALACVSDSACQGPVAVYDFGGGTFDFSVVHVGPDKMKVVTTAGDGWLGGDDFDEALAGAAANAFWQQTQIELRNQVHHWRRLLFRAEGAKRNLTDEEETTVRLPGAANTAEGELDLVYPITRDKFAELTGGIVKRSLETCRAALKARKLEPTDLNAVFLSGGTTYIPAVRDAVAEFFGQTPRVVVPPERAVLVGAAVHGALFHKELAQRLVQ